MGRFSLVAIAIGLSSWLGAASLPASAVRQPDGTVSFEAAPRLLDARTTFSSVRMRGAKHYFTLVLPENAGEPLKTVQIQQRRAADEIDYDLEDTIAFTGERRKSGEAIAIQSVSLDPETQAISVTFAEPVVPGTTLTIGLFPERNPRFSGVYLFRVTAFPDGEKPFGLNLGTARLHFYQDGGRNFI